MSAQYSDKYVVGVDFGTLTARALVVRVSDGREVGTGVHAYRHGVIDQRLPISGEELPPDWALQDPDDYLESIGVAVRLAVSSSRVDPASIVGIATDFTACTMVPTLADGTPLCTLPEFKDRPHAYVKLWRHHAAQPQADRINRIAAARNESWLRRYGGFISAEWEFAKGLELLENDARDLSRRWSVGSRLPTGSSGRCADATCATHAAPGTRGFARTGMYPSRGFLVELNPAFGDFVTDKARPAGRRPRRCSRNPHGGCRGATRSARGNRGRGRQRRCACDRTGGACRRTRSPCGDHGHVDLPCRQRHAASTRCPGCAVSSTAASLRAVGDTRRVRAASAICSRGA